MNKNLLLTRSNLRKARGQTIAIIVLVLLASIMMNLWIMLGIDYKANFDRTHDRLNDGHVNLCFVDDNEMVNFLKNKLDNSPKVTEYCITDFIYASLNNFNLNAFDEDTMLSRDVGKFEIVEDSEYKSGIYLPIIEKGNADWQHQIGDDYKIDMGDGAELNCTVCGFMNSAMMGSDNCSICGYMLTKDKYEELSGMAADFRKWVCVSIRLKDKFQSGEFETELKNALTDKSVELGYDGFGLNTNSYELVSTTRYISQSICAATISGMAFVIILIAVVVISSNVVNYIKENMQNLGALKAIGYTSRQLIAAQTAQFSGVALVSSIAGIALSYAIFPYVVEMMDAQTGIPYSVRFLSILCIVTIAAIVGTVALTVFLSARGIKKIEPITALRQGISTHNFKKNHVPLDKTAVPINFALALKTTLSGVKQNVTICITMLVLSLILVFAGVMYKNVIADVKPMLNMVVGNIADYAVAIDKNDEEEFIREIEKDSRVEKIHQFSQDYLLHKGGAELEVRYSDDPSKINNQKFIIEGRFPKYENEVALGAKYAKDNGLKIGDEIMLSYEGKSFTYLITGYTQYSNSLGADCFLTNKGFDKIADSYGIANYIDLKDGTDIVEFDKEILERFGDKKILTEKIQTFMEENLSVFTSLVTAIVAAIGVLSVLIILFVLYLLVRMLLSNKKRDYGILKALGYTTRQLILQTAFSFMPTIVISTAAGIALSSFVVNPLIAALLGGIGIVKCTFDVPVLFNIIAGVCLILTAFGTACLLSLRIRIITPRELLSGE